MTTWRVLTWNILGRRIDPNLDVISKVISGYVPDVVALQEVRRHQARGHCTTPRLEGRVDPQALPVLATRVVACRGSGDAHAALGQRA